MKTILRRSIMCQSRGCENKATWREIDEYTQQGQTHTYFYYMCDEHKDKYNHKALSHKREFQKLL